MRFVPPRWLVITIVAIAFTLAALVSASVVTVRAPFPVTTGELTFPALSRPVEVVRGAYGIPEIRADNAEDLFTAQGFVHAQERFFEMDVRRHTTSGRLAELFGDDLWETDQVIRTMGWRQAAEADYQQLPADTRRYLDAYASGVNHYLEHNGGSIALEYELLGLQGVDTEPEPWTAVDSVAWLKAMAWSLDGNLRDEVLQGVMGHVVGPTRAAELFPPNRPDVYAPVVGETRPAGAGDPDDTRARVAALLATARAADRVKPMIADPGLGADVGSNSWVVSGERTSTGKPILANDPHLAASVPSTFLQMRLRCTTVSSECPFDVGGYSFSGMPGIIIGHNEHIGWGLTVPYIDTQDLYVERIVDGRAQRVDGAEDVETRTETLRSSSGNTKEITVRRTSNGPLISDAGLADPVRQTAGPADGTATDGAEYAVALRWTALDPSASLQAIFDLNTAEDFTDFRRAAQELRSPSQNLVYADVDGNIGYQLPGAVPRRAQGNGRVPIDAWTTDAAWQGFEAFDDLPRVYNPPEGFIVAANQDITTGKIPQQAGNSFGYRSQPIHDALAERSDWDPQSTADLQMTDTVRWADKLVPALLAAQPVEPWVTDGQEVLAAWDRRADPDSAGMAFFAIAARQVLQRTFGDEVPDELGPGQGSDQFFAVLDSILDDPQNPWWDDITTPQIEDRDEILAAALLAARKEITAEMAVDPEDWEWGKLHTLTLTHQTLGTSGIAPVEWLFNLSERPVGGGTAVVEAWGWDRAGEDFSVVNGPTMRMVVDFSDFDRSRWVNQSGTSGHVMHEHYADQTPLILRGETYPWAWTRPAVDAADPDVLRLVPPA